MTDHDYQGLSRIADVGLQKEAGLPEITTGNRLADMGLYFIPGVGTGLTAYDAARSYSDAVSDFGKGKVLKGLGNLGSGVLSTGLAGLDFLTLGLGGRLVGGGMKLLGRGARLLGNGARTAAAIGKGSDASDKLYRAGRKLSLADRRLRSKGNRWARSKGGWVGRQLADHKTRTGLASIPLMLGTGLLGSGMLTGDGDAGDTA